MKKIILLLAVILCWGYIFAENQTVKFYLNNDNVKSYNIEDIEKMSMTNSQSGMDMKVFRKDSLTAFYETINIDSIRFESVDNIIRNLVVYIKSSMPQSHLLYNIDSIVFSIPSPPTAVIESIYPSSAIIGDEISISGSGFGATKSGSSVTFTGGEVTSYISWADDEIGVRVPEGAQTGYMAVIVNGVKSNEKYFKVIPQITEINPTSGKAGDEITITGNGFGNEQGAGRVYFGDTRATEFTIWSDTEIKVKIPTDATSGTVYVKIQSQTSNEVDFTLIEIPTITDIDPISFSVGSNVTINGSGFGNVQGNSTVYFKTTKATTITYWENNQIICKVPKGSKTGTLSVTVNSVKSNEVAYTIVELVETVLIPSGNFQMGNTGSMPSINYVPETPVHQVSIRNSFYMSTYEVQQDLYESVMNTNPSSNKGGNLPVDRISWYMALEFCNALSELEGLEKCYSGNSCNWNANGWRLPTEAEWEYACKAGTSSDFYNGSSESDLADAAWYSVNSGEVSHPVGQKTPNSKGLYDMLGNLSELCWDWTGTYDSGSQSDPKGPSSGTWKIARGGSWHQSASMCRSSMRGWIDSPDMQSSAVGFRIVRLNK